MHIGNYLELLLKSEKDLVKAFKMVAKEHGDEPDVYETCQLLASWSENRIENLEPLVKKYGEERNNEPDKLTKTLFDKPRKGSLALLRDLHDLWLLANEASLCSIILRQAAQGLRDEELTEVCDNIQNLSKRQLSWLLTRMKSAAPQTLIVAE